VAPFRIKSLGWKEQQCGRGLVLEATWGI
jgi:hypothetical protein